ncbi:MAG: SpoIID/LytB domain-containing protein [Candidatus Limiplasma sp.]|nr:SpoIID/LytB domain-containing protein [Candidatus Limiplasma sp.]
MTGLSFFPWRRRLALCLCLLLWAAALPQAHALGENAYPPARERSQIVRVLLSRLGITNRMDLTLDGVYGLGSKGESGMIFERGSEITLLARNGSLFVYYQGMSFHAGASLYLTRYQGEADRENGIRITGEPALYPGDLQLELDGENIRPILHIHVEDYLLGVVPYEMSNDFPLEALKAQAVTARTYALRKQNSSKGYDLVDTTNDQVFKGVLGGYERAAQAVAQTRGLCGFYKDKLAECFYGASNGGQTELVQHVWNGPGDYGYYAMTDDPYDLQNPASLIKSVTILKKPGSGEVAGYGLRALLVKGLAQALAEKGYDPAPESLRVDEVQALSLDTPAFAEPSRLMTQMHITFKYSGRTRMEGVIPAGLTASAPLPSLDEDQEDVSLFVTPGPTAAATPMPTPSPTAVPSGEGTETAGTPALTPVPTPLPTPEPVYGPFEPVQEAVTLTLPVFPEAKSLLALELNPGYNNELLTVVEKSDRFVVQSRRYGHGVGMSQRGAEWMAAFYRKTFMEILAFYYPGMDVKQYPDQDRALPALDMDRLATPGPKPTPTPRPTLMPVTQEATDGAWYALVTGIEDGSTLNLRAAPDLSGEVLMRLYKHQRLLVIQRCQEEGWVKVRTDVIEGYVMEKFLQKE